MTNPPPPEPLPPNPPLQNILTIEDDLNVKSLEIAFINAAGIGEAALYTFEAIPNIISTSYTVGDKYIDITLRQESVNKYAEYAYSINGGSSWVNVEVSNSFNFTITGLTNLTSYTVYVKAINNESYYHQVLVGLNITPFNKQTIEIKDIDKTNSSIEIKFTSQTDSLPTLNVVYILKNGSSITKNYTLSLNGNGDLLATEII